MCVEKPSGEPLNDTDRKNYAIHNETMRSRYHKKMTDKNFSGRWESRGGVINIPESFNEYCEFKFKTEVDNKEYTMYIVDDKGQNINLLNFADTKLDTLRAKGIFVDNNLRSIEDRFNLPRLSYHGYADLQMNMKTDGINRDIENQLTPDSTLQKSCFPKK